MIWESCGVRRAACGVEGTFLRASWSAIRQRLSMDVVVRENVARRTPHAARLSIMLSLVAKANRRLQCRAISRTMP